MDHGVFQKVLILIAADRQKIREDYQRALKHAYMLGLSFSNRYAENLKNWPQKMPGCVQCGREMEARYVSCTVVYVEYPDQLASLCEAGKYQECISDVRFCLNCGGSWYGDQYVVRVTPGKRFIINGDCMVVDSVRLINSRNEVVHNQKFGDLKVAFMQLT